MTQICRRYRANIVPYNKDSLVVPHMQIQLEHDVSPYEIWPYGEIESNGVNELLFTYIKLAYLASVALKCILV